MGLQKPVVAGCGGSAVGDGCAHCPVLEPFPAVRSFLFDVRWEDGSPRKTGTITLMVDLGVLKAALNCRDTETSTFVSGQTLFQLLESIEKGLGAGTLEWRRKTPYNSNGRRK